jgi:hypothetical protein
MRKKVKIVTVDRFGFCGREYHPSESDIGKTGVILTSMIECGDGHGHCYCTDNREDIEKAAELIDEADSNPDGDVWAYAFYLCKMDDGQLLELVEYEIETI